MDNAIEDWKAWHRELSDVLGCEYLERTVTLETAKRLRDRLAAIERQVIYRTEDIPEWAVAWEKVWPMTSQVAVCRWVISGGHTSQPAPDLRPDGHGPFFLPIIDAHDVGADK